MPQSDEGDEAQQAQAQEEALTLAHARSWLSAASRAPDRGGGARCRAGPDEGSPGLVGGVLGQSERKPTDNPRRHGKTEREERRPEAGPVLPGARHATPPSQVRQARVLMRSPPLACGFDRIVVRPNSLPYT